MRPSVVVIVKRTAYRHYLEEGEDRRVMQLIRRGDPTVAALKKSHDAHEQTVTEVRSALEHLGARSRFVHRAHAAFACEDADLVVTVGGDGTLLAASHRVGGVPILGINSAPSYSVGFFCGAKKGGALRALKMALEGALPSIRLARMEVVVNRTVVASRVLNEALFCHASPAATTRYILELGPRIEEQKSSGFWVGPAAGSTAAQRSAGGAILPLTSRRLQLVVREPYTPAGDKLSIRRAFVPPGEELVVRSKMHDGRLFFDGPHDSCAVTRGDSIRFRRSSESLRVMALTPHRVWGNVPR